MTTSRCARIQSEAPESSPFFSFGSNTKPPTENLLPGRRTTSKSSAAIRNCEKRGSNVTALSQETVPSTRGSDMPGRLSSPATLTPLNATWAEAAPRRLDTANGYGRLQCTRRNLFDTRSKLIDARHRHVTHGEQHGSAIKNNATSVHANTSQTRCNARPGRMPKRGAPDHRRVRGRLTALSWRAPRCVAT